MTTEQTRLDYASLPGRRRRVIDSVRRGAAIAALAFLALFVGAWAFLLWRDRDDSGPYFGLAIVVAGLLAAAAVSAAIWLAACVAVRRAG